MNPMSSDIGYTMTLYDAGKSWDGKSRAAVMARVVFTAPSDIDAEATVTLARDGRVIILCARHARTRPCANVAAGAAGALHPR